MFATPPFVHCPANAWTTLYRGMVLPFGVMEIVGRPATGGATIPLTRYKLIFATPPYYYDGAVNIPIGLVTGPTPWCELAVRPERDWDMRATGY